MKERPRRRRPAAEGHLSHRSRSRAVGSILWKPALIPRFALVAASSLFIAPGVGAQCRPVESQACVLTLHGESGPAASKSCTSEAWKEHLRFELAERFSDANEDGWWEAVIRLELRPEDGCNCAAFRITYGAEPRGFSVHIGDSPTNDGFGGDEGTTAHCAEAQLRGLSLTVFSALSRPGQPYGVDPVLEIDLPPLEDRKIELKACDQFFSFSVPRSGSEEPQIGHLRSPNTQQLFAIGSPPTRGGTVPRDQLDYAIYAAFNRVIHHRRGEPSQGRFGAGARRVEIFLTP